MSELARIDVEVVDATDRAILVYDGDSTVWIPRSQIHDDSEVWGSDPQDGVLVIPQWLAEAKGLV